MARPQTMAVWVAALVVTSGLIVYLSLSTNMHAGNADAGPHVVQGLSRLNKLQPQQGGWRKERDPSPFGPYSKRRFGSSASRWTGDSVSGDGHQIYAEKYYRPYIDETRPKRFQQVLRYRLPPPEQRSKYGVITLLRSAGDDDMYLCAYLVQTATLRKHWPKDVSVDILAIVDVDVVTQKQLDLLRQLGVLPVFVKAPASYTPDRFRQDKPEYASSYEAWWALNYNSIFKVLVYGITEYEMLFHLDADILVRKPLPVHMWIDALQTYEFVAHVGIHEPVNGGIWLVRPSDSAMNDVLDAIDAGYDPELGWNKTGGYIDMWRPPGEYFCNFWQGEQRKRCDAGGPLNWEIPYFETDQGLHYYVFHVVRKSLMQRGTKTMSSVLVPEEEWFPIFHFVSEHYKPWNLKTAKDNDTEQDENLRRFGHELQLSWHRVWAEEVLPFVKQRMGNEASNHLQCFDRVTRQAVELEPEFRNTTRQVHFFTYTFEY